MAGYYGLHDFMLWCVVVASGSSGQSDGGICGVVSRLEALQAQIASELELLAKDITELGKCDKVLVDSCPGVQRVGGKTYCEKVKKMKVQGNNSCRRSCLTRGRYLLSYLYSYRYLF